MKRLLVVLALLCPVAAAAAQPVPYLPVQHGAAVILNTGSTNTLGYRIVIQKSGAAEFINGDRRATATVPAAITTQLFTDLQAAMPMRNFPMIHCMKSASFGTSLFVWWKGARSNDISCGTNVLTNDVTAVAQALGVGNGARYPMHPIPLLTNEPRQGAPVPSATPRA